jgi:hypothetical protein
MKDGVNIAINRLLLAAATIGALASCGGSSDTPIIQSQSAPAIEAARVVDANSLLNWAEIAYSSLFPSHQPNVILEPFTYRYYPETQNYVGLAGNRVYVLGPLSGGSLLDVGRADDFFCNVYPSSCLTPTITSIRESQTTELRDLARGQQTYSSRLTFSGKLSNALAPNLRIRIADGDLRLLGYAQMSTTLDWSFATSEYLALGRHSFSAVVVDQADTVVESSQTWDIDILSRTPTRDFRSIAVSSGLSCAINPQKSLTCWPANSDFEPNIIPNTEDAAAVAIAPNAGHACIVVLNGTVRCWGGNGVGQLGSAGPSVMVPKSVPDLANVVDVVTGSNNTCALRVDGKVFCWGQMVYFDLYREGNATFNTLVAYGDFLLSVPTEIPGLTDVVQLSAAYNRICALRRNGVVTCFGGTPTTFPYSPSEVANFVGKLKLYDVPGMRGIRSMSVGTRQVCGIVITGEVICWGINDFGSLGAPIRDEPYLTAVRVEGVTDAIGITSGEHTCVVTASRLTKCWGDHEQIYNGWLDSVAVDAMSSGGSAVEVPLLQGMVILARSDTSFYTLCGQHENGHIMCWGYSLSGDLGVKFLQKSPNGDYNFPPTQVLGL